MSGNDSLFGDQAYEFAVGTIRGIRAWIPTTSGTLRSPSMYYDWLPGENIAECRSTFMHEPGGYMLDAYMNLTMKYGHEDGGKRWAELRDQVSKDPHARCHTGFYAYYTVGDQHGNYVNTRSVVGIIEAYGKVKVGTKGFRAEKAKIVAVAHPVDFEEFLLYGGARVQDPLWRSYIQLSRNEKKYPTYRDDQRPRMPVVTNGPLASLMDRVAASPVLGSIGSRAGTDAETFEYLTKRNYPGITIHKNITDLVNAWPLDESKATATKALDPTGTDG